MKDIQKEQKGINEKKVKQKTAQKVFDADDDDEDAEETLLSECVDKCEKEAWFILFFFFELHFSSVEWLPIFLVTSDREILM